MSDDHTASPSPGVASPSVSDQGAPEQTERDESRAHAAPQRRRRPPTRPGTLGKLIPLPASCSACGQSLPPDRHRGRCERCQAADSARARLEREYGLTPAEVAEMAQAQGHRCAVCGEPEALEIDHDHRTGAVRALLCSGCNSGIARFREDSERLRAAIRYLAEHKGGSR